MRQAPDALINTTPIAPGDRHVFHFVRPQRIQVAVKAAAHRRITGDQARQRDLRLQTGLIAGDAASAIALFPPAEIPLDIPAGIGMKDLAILADRGMVVQGCQQRRPGAVLGAVMRAADIFLNSAQASPANCASSQATATRRTFRVAAWPKRECRLRRRRSIRPDGR